MTNKSLVKAIWPFAVSGKDKISGEWYVRKSPNSYNPLVFKCSTEAMAWKETAVWIKDTVKKYIL